MIVYRSGFCVILAHRDVHLLNLGCGKFNFSRLRLFFQPRWIFRIGSKLSFDHRHRAQPGDFTRNLSAYHDVHH